MSLQLRSFLSVFLAISGVISTPLQESSHKDEQLFLMSLKNRSYRQPLPFDEDIFDPTFVSNEIRGVISKYEEAARFYGGIDINTTTRLPPIPPILAANHIMSLTDHHDRNMDLLYYGSLSVGTPRQTFNVQLDTGSADLWLPTDCPDCIGNQFKPEDSRTYKSTNKPFQESYGRGEVSGTICSDMVTVAGLSVNQQFFGAINKKSEEFSRDPNEGLLGLAFREISRTQEATFFENVVETNQIPPVFSVHLTRRSEGSEVCFGCRDESKATGPVHWIPLVSRSYWSVYMDALSLNSTTSIETSLIAAIDTGTSLIYVPEPLADEFYAQIPGSRKASQFGPNFYSYPCASALAPSLSFNGTAFSIDMRDFNLGKTGYGSPDCVGGIMSLGEFSDELAIVGAEFIKSWYTTFDSQVPGQVGFASSVNSQGH